MDDFEQLYVRSVQVKNMFRINYKNTRLLDSINSKLTNKSLKQCELTLFWGIHGRAFI